MNIKVENIDVILDYLTYMHSLCKADQDEVYKMLSDKSEGEVQANINALYSRLKNGVNLYNLSYAFAWGDSPSGDGHWRKVCYKKRRDMTSWNVKYNLQKLKI